LWAPATRATCTASIHPQSREECPNSPPAHRNIGRVRYAVRRLAERDMQYLRHTTKKLAQQHIRDRTRLLLEAEDKNIGQRTRLPQREKSRISSQSDEPKPRTALGCMLCRPSTRLVAFWARARRGCCRADVGEAIRPRTRPACGSRRVWPRCRNRARNRGWSRGTASAVQKETEETGEAITPEFPVITPHELRHTCASLAISAGANVKVLQSLLGHKTATLTLDPLRSPVPRRPRPDRGRVRRRHRTHCGLAADWTSTQGGPLRSK
jgi:hypothetical protein